MSLLNRFSRAVRARVGGLLEGPAEVDTHAEPSLEESPHDAPPHADAPRTHAAPPRAPTSGTRPFAVGDQVIVQSDGLAEITHKTTLDHDGLPAAVFELRTRRGRRMVTEADAPDVMRHLVDPDAAAIARSLLFAEDVEPDPRPWHERATDLDRARQQLDLGPVAKGVRDLLGRGGARTAAEDTVLQGLREVACDEIEAVLSLPEGSLARQLDARFG